MSTKNERLKQVYEHLRKHFGIHTQTDFAASIKITRPALSSALNGNELYLTNNLFKRICTAYPGVFNLDYLLTGNGDLLTIDEDAKSSEIEKTANPSYNEKAAYDNLIEILARTIRGVDDLRVQLHQELVEVRSLKEELQKITHRPVVYIEKEQQYESVAEPN